VHTTGTLLLVFELDILPPSLRFDLVLSLPSEQIPVAPVDYSQSNSQKVPLRSAALSIKSALQATSGFSQRFSMQHRPRPPRWHLRCNLPLLALCGRGALWETTAPPPSPPPQSPPLSLAPLSQSIYILYLHHRPRVATIYVHPWSRPQHRQRSAKPLRSRTAYH
jgi:hypothetical protein